MFSFFGERERESKRARERESWRELERERKSLTNEERGEGGGGEREREASHTWQPFRRSDFNYFNITAGYCPFLAKFSIIYFHLACKFL